MDSLVDRPELARRSVTFDDSEYPPHAGPRKDTTNRTRTPSTSSARSSSSQRTSSVEKPASVVRSLSSSQSRRATSQTSQPREDSTAREAGRRTKTSTGAANKPAPSDPLTEITTRALNTLQIPALKSVMAAVSRSGPKEKRAAMNKVQATVLRAHLDGAKAMEALFVQETDALFEVFLRESLVQHSREITRLQTARAAERVAAQRRLEHAAQTSETLFEGVVSLLGAAREAGTALCAESGLLDEPSALATQHESVTSPMTVGRAMPEVRDQEASWFPRPSTGERHGPQRPTAAERDALQSIRGFFDTVTDGVRGGCDGGAQGSDARDGRSAQRASCTRPTTAPSSPVEPAWMAAALPTPSVSPAALGAELSRLTTAVAALLEQLRQRDSAQQAQITAQKRVLDEHATRLKRADDVLRDTVAQDYAEASYTVQRLESLDAALRARMDAVEEGTQLALTALIDARTDVCIDNNVYSDRSALQQYREDATHRFMTRMDGLQVEQADMLRGVQEALVTMSHRAARRGREEKVVEVHSVLPLTTRAFLENTCDRATLLRFLHHLTLHSEEALCLLIGVASEYAQYLETNPTEAATVRDAARSRTAVMALLTKMYEESLITCNPHGVRPSLTETLEHIVDQYNTFMGFQIDHAMAALRQSEHHASLIAQRQPHQAGHGGFFSETVPLPASMVEADGGHNANPYSATLYQPRAPGRPFQGSGMVPTTPTTTTTTTNKKMVNLAVLSSSAAHTSGFAVPVRAVAETVVALQCAHPSQPQPQRGTATSVVGDGRWCGAAPVRVESPRSTPSTRTGARGVGAGQDALARTQPCLPPVSTRHVSSVTAALSSQAVAQSVPAPAVPPRKFLAAHVLSEYGHGVDAALDAVRDYRATSGRRVQTNPAPIASLSLAAATAIGDGGDAASTDAPAYVPGSIRTTFAPLVMGEDTTSEAARVFVSKRRQLAYQDGDSEYIEKQRQTFSAFATPNVNYV